MPDIFSKRKRSDVMSRIRSAGNKDTELRLIQIFRAHGIIRLRQGYDGTSRLEARQPPELRFDCTYVRN